MAHGGLLVLSVRLWKVLQSVGVWVSLLMGGMSGGPATYGRQNTGGLPDIQRILGASRLEKVRPAAKRHK